MQQPQKWAPLQHQQDPAAHGYPPAHTGYGALQSQGCANYARHAPPHEYEYGPHRPPYDTTITWNASSGAVEQSARPCADCARSVYRVCAQHQQDVAPHRAPQAAPFTDYSNAYGSLRTPSNSSRDPVPTGPQSHMYYQHRPEQQLSAPASHPDLSPSYHHVPHPFPFPPLVSQQYHPQHQAPAHQQAGAQMGYVHPGGNTAQHYATESHPINLQPSARAVQHISSEPSRPSSQLSYRHAEPPGGINTLADVASALLREENERAVQPGVSALAAEASDSAPSV